MGRGGGPVPGELRGFVAVGFERVADVFASAAAEAGEHGAAVCVTVEGEIVLDAAWGSAHGRSWETDTLVPVLSSCKAFTAVVAMVLADRGLLDVDAPVASLWPEFARNGKDTVLTRHVLEHTAGVLSFPGHGSLAGVDNRGLFDRDAVVSGIEASELSWTPGTQSRYHPLTFGWIMDELVRRVDGRSTGEFLRDVIGMPLSIDVHLGTPSDVDSRVTALLPPAEPGVSLDATSRAAQFLPDGLDDAEQWICDVVNDPYLRARELPGVNGIASAAGLCGLYTPLANGGRFDGGSLVDPSSIARFTSPGHLPDGQRHGYGMGLTVFPLLAPQGVEAFGHSGSGGSRGLADPGRRLAFGYVKNRMLPTRALTSAEASPSLAVLAAACSVLDR